MERVNKRKLGNKVVQTGGVMIIGKAQKKIIDRKIIKFVFIYYTLIKAKKLAYNGIVES